MVLCSEWAGYMGLGLEGRSSSGLIYMLGGSYGEGVLPVPASVGSTIWTTWVPEGICQQGTQ